MSNPLRRFVAAAAVVLAAALILAVSRPAYAGEPFDGLYLEAAAGAHAESYDCDEGRNNGAYCAANMLGRVAVGYEFAGRLRGWEVSVEHQSSFQEFDRGINAVWIKYRWGGR